MKTTKKLLALLFVGILSICLAGRCADDKASSKADEVSSDVKPKSMSRLSRGVGDWDGKSDGGEPGGPCRQRL